MQRFAGSLLLEGAGDNRPTGGTLLDLHPSARHAGAVFDNTQANTEITFLAGIAAQPVIRDAQQYGVSILCQPDQDLRRVGVLNGVLHRFLGNAI